MQEEVETEAFATSLRGVFMKQHAHSLMKNELARFWSTISHVPFSAALVSSDIVDPVHRFLHKNLSATLVGRGTSENKVNHVELFCLMCLTENRPANVASVLAWSMKRTWRGGTGAGIYCGPYVTKIAGSLGVFNRYPAGLMRKGPTLSWIGLKELQGSCIVTLTEPFALEPIKQGPQVQPPPDTEAATALQAGVPTRYQRPPQRAELPGRQYPLAQPRPVPLTLNSLYDSMETGFVQLHGYTGNVRQLMEEDRRSHEDWRTACGLLWRVFICSRRHLGNHSRLRRGRVVWRACSFLMGLVEVMKRTGIRRIEETVDVCCRFRSRVRLGTVC
ncbi:hypothetical protein HanPI659440_Chr12g0471851 [Helianthus annuus]|nr:hypothetical protein HanPI659440_Chr12g0471851 [Helianthus annuus]